MIVLPSGIPRFLVTTKIFSDVDDIALELDPTLFMDRFVFVDVEGEIVPAQSDGTEWLLQEVIE